MNLPGYDAWKLRGPEEPRGPTCDFCDSPDGVRVLHDGYGPVKPSLICEDCYTAEDDGPCFDDLQPAQEYFEDQRDAAADLKMELRRERKGYE